MDPHFQTKSYPNHNPANSRSLTKFGLCQKPYKDNQKKRVEYTWQPR